MSARLEPPPLAPPDIVVDGPFADHPITPAGRVLDHPLMVRLFIVFVGCAAVLAYWHDGGVLLTWDEPVQRWVEHRRTAEWGELFRTASRLGSNVVIFGLGAVMAAIAATRSRVLAVTIVGAVLMRPAMEFVAKAVISRPRPDFDRLVDGVGFSHPSGHVLASVALYGLLPAVIALFTTRALWWWLSAVPVVVVLVPMIAASRVYLGVHWLTDVVAGLAWGTLYLLAVEWVFVRLLRRFPGHHEADVWRRFVHHPIETIHELDGSRHRRPAT